MADLTAIKTALYDLATGDAVLMALITGVYDTLAPHGTSYPYLVLTIIDATDLWNQDGHMDTVRIQADIYDNARSAATANTCMNALEAAFNFAFVPDGTSVYFDGTLAPQQTRTLREAPDVWRLSRDYILLLARIARRM